MLEFVVLLIVVMAVGGIIRNFPLLNVALFGFLLLFIYIITRILIV